jgi:hypothetical protein
MPQKPDAIGIGGLPRAVAVRVSRALSVVSTEAERREAKWRDLFSAAYGLSLKKSPSTPLRSGRDDGVRQARRITGSERMPRKKLE